MDTFAVNKSLEGEGKVQVEQVPDLSSYFATIPVLFRSADLRSFQPHPRNDCNDDFPTFFTSSASRCDDRYQDNDLSLFISFTSALSVPGDKFDVVKPV